VFLTSCVDSREEDIQEMVSQAETCSYEEMGHVCDLSGFEQVLGYARMDIPLWEDVHVRYCKSWYRGCPCYYLEHSHIEYIWVLAQDWEPERMKHAP